VSEGEVFRLDDLHYEAPNLDLPSPPPDLPYADYADWHDRAVLAANGVDDARAGLSHPDGLLRAAAAHTAGADGDPAVIPRLRELAADREDDAAAVEAAYALARLGAAEDGVPVLRAALALPVGAYLSPITAAGYLARLGDASGLDVIRAALDSELLASRMLAVKQLYFFLDLDDDARRLLERARDDDPEPSVRAQAAAELAA
jgi:HEAT repeat protein